MNLDTQAYSEKWQNCLMEIQKQTSEDEFVKWFKPIVPLEFDGVTLHLRVPNESYVYHIEKNYLKFLKPIIYQSFGIKTRLRYVMPKDGGVNQVEIQGADNTAINRFIAQTDTANIKNPFILPGIRRAMVNPQLNPTYDMESFVEGECNRLARSVGLTVAASPGSTPFNPLYIYGDSGLGKTHLVQAIGAEVRRMHPNIQVLYVPMNTFQAQYTSAILNKEFNDFIRFYQMIDVLIIDDIQELSGKEKTQNVFFNIFNHLQLSGKQLIITSDKPPVELKDIENRLLTRFKWGLSAQLTPPDYETKVRIINNKATKLDTKLSDEVVHYIADNINANVREIEGALSSMVANAKFLNKNINISLAKEILKVYVEYSIKEVTIEHILKTVCDYYTIVMSAIDSPSRTRDVVQARQVAMFLSKRHTKASLANIGSEIGGRNHTTVLHALKSVDNLMETDRLFKHQLEEIERKVLSTK